MDEYKPGKQIELQAFTVVVPEHSNKTIRVRYFFKSSYRRGFTPGTNNTEVSIITLSRHGAKHIDTIDTRRTKGIIESFRDWCFDWLFGHVPIGSVIEDRGCLFKVG